MVPYKLASEQQLKIFTTGSLIIHIISRNHTLTRNIKINDLEIKIGDLVKRQGLTT